MINPQQPSETVNTLELVALCCEGEMIDANIIKRTFGDQFVTHYEDVKKCHRIPHVCKLRSWPR